MNLIKKILILTFSFATLFVLTPQKSHAVILDLTGGGNGFIDAAYFQWMDSQSTGTGVIDSFVRLQNRESEEGYNTSGRPLTNWPDVNTSPVFTRDLTLGSVPIVNIGGTDYREFLLDINQTSNNPLLSLDQIKIYLGSSGGLTTATLSDLGTLVYNLDASANNWIKLDYSLNSGSGSGDMLAYIPNSVFIGPSQYVYF